MDGLWYQLWETVETVDRFRPLVAESWSACRTPTWVDTYRRASLCGSPRFQRSSGTGLEEKKERVCTHWSGVEEQCHFPGITSPPRQHNLGQNKTARDVVPWFLPQGKGTAGEWMPSFLSCAGYCQRDSLLSVTASTLLRWQGSRSGKWYLRFSEGIKGT